MEASHHEVLEEIARLKYLYKMKGVFRFGTARDPHQRSESNAEHLYGLFVLSAYFTPRLPESLDRLRIHDLILVHDLDEIEGGDIISYQKTPEDRQREAEAMQTALESMPQLVAFDSRALVQEYQEQITREAQFVKACDKLEPLLEVFDRYGKEVMRRNQTTREQAVKSKVQYLAPFPLIERYFAVLVAEMDQQGFFYEPG